MAITQTLEIPEERAGIFGEPHRSSTRRLWRITTDDPTDNPVTIYAASSLPRFLDSHPNSSTLLCRAVTVEVHKKPYIWDAVATYTDEPVTWSALEKKLYPNPLDRRTRVSIDGVEFERLVTADRDGNALINSAGDPYPAQVIDDTRRILRLRKNVSTWNAVWWTYENQVNDGAKTFSDGYTSFSFATEVGLLKPLQLSDLQQEGAYNYYILTGEVHINPDGWTRSLVDEGMQYLDAGVKKLIMVQDENGDDIQPATTQLLDGSGGVLAVGGTPVLNDFDIIPKSTWALLPF